MKVTRTTLVAAAVAVAAIAAGSALAATQKTVAFSGTYAGNATTKVTGSDVDISAQGTGKGTLIGAGKIMGTGKGDASDPPSCIPFWGPATISGTGGKLNLNVLRTSKGCGSQDDPGVSIVGYAKVVSATGKLKGLKGTLKFTGTYNRSSGAFKVKFAGSLKA